MQPRQALPQIFTLGNKYLLHFQVRGNVLPQNYVHHLVLLTAKFVVLEWNGGHWNINKIVCFGHLQNVRKGFSKIKDIVKYSLQNWIISHRHVIQSHIPKDYIKVNFDDVNGGVKTEIRQKVLITSICSPTTYRHVKNTQLVFPWHMMKKDL